MSVRCEWAAAIHCGGELLPPGQLAPDGQEATDSGDSVLVISGGGDCFCVEGRPHELEDFARRLLAVVRGEE